MFGLHVKDVMAMSVGEAVKFGFISWGLLAVSIAIICGIVYILNKATSKKDK